MPDSMGLLYKYGEEGAIFYNAFLNGVHITFFFFPVGTDQMHSLDSYV
jgi:hypothetical protein